jgi:hypothetical protein
MMEQITMGKPTTYRGETRIECVYSPGHWDQRRTLTLARRADETSWRIYEDRVSYIGNGMVCTHNITPYGHSLTLREAKRRAIDLFTDYHARTAVQN